MTTAHWVIELNGPTKGLDTMAPWSVEAWLALGRLLADAAWPIAAIVSILVFRREIAAALSRLRKLPGGTELAAAERLQEAASVQGKTVPPNEFEMMILPEVRNALREELNGEIAGLSSSDQIEKLSGYLVLARRAVVYLNFSRLIFGSQLELLARSAAVESLDREGIESVYKVHVTKGGSMTLDEWLRYPLAKSLVAGSADRIVITPRGRDYLSFTTSVIGDTPINRPY